MQHVHTVPKIMIIVSALAPAQQQTRDLRSLVVIKLQVAGQCRPCGVPSSWVFRITNVIAKITWFPWFPCFPVRMVHLKATVRTRVVERSECRLPWLPQYIDRRLVSRCEPSQIPASMCHKCDRRNHMVPREMLINSVRICAKYTNLRL